MTAMKNEREPQSSIPPPRIIPTLQEGSFCTLPVVRELVSSEFDQAAIVWKDYHETTGDASVDRIFGVFSGEELVSLARCRRHSGGLEVDGIYTPESHRGHGYSRMAVSALVEACHNEDLHMYAVRHLIGFYATFGFTQIPEKALPPSIRERYTWAGGNLEGADVQPIVRKAGTGTLLSR